MRRVHGTPTSALHVGQLTVRARMVLRLSSIIGGDPFRRLYPSTAVCWRSSAATPATLSLFVSETCTRGNKPTVGGSGGRSAGHDVSPPVRVILTPFQIVDRFPKTCLRPPSLQPISRRVAVISFIRG